MSESATLRVSLLGQLDIQWNDGTVVDLGASRAQELLSYLLLYRERLHSRDVLADLLWGDTTPGRQAKAYLRKTLWQIERALERRPDSGTIPLLRIDQETVRVDPKAKWWVDTAVLEGAFRRVRGIEGHELSDDQAAALRRAVALYRGDLLEGWYQDWCVYERARLQHIYLLLLDKLMSYCEAHARYEQGLVYGSRALQYDHAHERTHRRMMRLYSKLHDRTSALRQYQACATALREELNVEPSQRTVALYEKLRSDESVPIAPDSSCAYDSSAGSLIDALTDLRDLQKALSSLSQKVQRDIFVVEKFLTGRH